MKATAIAPANIAFIKYWGKKNSALRIPLNDSFSMNLDGANTTTTVAFDSSLIVDEIQLVGGEFSDKETSRISKHLDVIRSHFNVSTKAKVRTQNSFPKGTGAASSASGFAALTVATVQALGKKSSQKELTILARIGSGSACRSIPDGFVVWRKGNSSETSVAESLYAPDYWDIRDVLVVVSTDMKKVSTSEGHSMVESSPFIYARVQGISVNMQRLTKAMDEKNFEQLGKIIEEDCLSMHAVMLTQKPALVYWNSDTLTLMYVVYQWRSEGVPIYFTMDAGPNVHLICEAKDENTVVEKVQRLNTSWKLLKNKPAFGTRLTDKHLF